MPRRPPTERSVTDEAGPQKNDIVIAMMGMSGSGKTAFINHFRFGEWSTRASELASSNIGIKIYPCRDESIGPFWLINTPGFGGGVKTDARVLNDVIRWLGAMKLDHLSITGIVYMHPVNGLRYSGGSRHNTDLLDRICGPNAISKVCLVTSAWGEVAARAGAENERLLFGTPEIWGDFRSGGALQHRYLGDMQSARVIIEKIVDSRAGAGTANGGVSQSGHVPEAAAELDAARRQHARDQERLRRLRRDKEAEMRAADQSHQSEMDRLRRRSRVSELEAEINEIKQRCQDVTESNDRARAVLASREDDQLDIEQGARRDEDRIDRARERMQRVDDDKKLRNSAAGKLFRW